MRKNIAIPFLVLSLILTTLSTLTPSSVYAQKEEVPYGPWVDEIVFFKEADYAKAVDMLEKGEMDIYLFAITDPDLFARIKTSPKLWYKVAYGLYNELTFNPAEFKVGFNPFTNPRIREAMNWLIDRHYICDEIFRGLAKPKWFSFISAFPEYGRLADVIKPLEAKYEYDFDKAKTVIYEEMAKMGCEFKEGKWYYKGEPVVLKFLIRTEDERRLIGDYVADQLEKLGFTVERLYKTAREAAPIWIGGDPAEGKWHIYTGGWITTVVSRYDHDHFGFFYTPLGLPYPLWMAYKPDPMFYEVAERLWRADWKDWDERMELMRKATELAIKDSVRVWLVDQISPFVGVEGLEAASDLSGGFAFPLWSRTLRWKDRIGGTVRAGSLHVLIDPWNPVAGTNWLYDALILNTVNSWAMTIHPYTGRYVNYNVLNWTVEREEKVGPILVPEDAWFGWDNEKKEIITAPPGTYAKVKVTANFGSVLGKVKYHDGSVMTLADWIALWPFGQIRATNPESPFYDEAAIPGYKSWRKNFRGMRIVSEDPLIIEYYTNYTAPEDDAQAAAVIGWPNTPWHMRALGMLAEEKGLLAFSDVKAKKLGVEWMNYIGGPSLDILAKLLDDAIETAYLPTDFKEFASKYITPDEARARYEALKEFYGKYGHFWVSSGPFYLYKADFTAHICVVKAFREYRWKADRWAWLAEPPIPEVTVKVPEETVPGLETSFEVDLEFKGKPYPSEWVDRVTYIVLDPSARPIAKGEAELVEKGVYNITLTSEDTGKMVPGSYRIMVIATSNQVGMPAMLEKSFTVIPETAFFKRTLSKALEELAMVREELTARIATVEESITPIREDVESLHETLGTLMGLTTASLAIAIISVVIGVVAIVRARRPS